MFLLLDVVLEHLSLLPLLLLHHSHSLSKKGIPPISSLSITYSVIANGINLILILIRDVSPSAVYRITPYTSDWCMCNLSILANLSLTCIPKKKVNFIVILSIYIIKTQRWSFEELYLLILLRSEYRTIRMFKITLKTNLNRLRYYCA